MIEVFVSIGVCCCLILFGGLTVWSLNRYREWAQTMFVEYLLVGYCIVPTVALMTGLAGLYWTFTNIPLSLVVR